MPVTFFYRGMGAKQKKKDQKSTLDFVQTRGAMRLLRAYAGIPERGSRAALVTLAEMLARGRRE